MTKNSEMRGQRLLPYDLYHIQFIQPAVATLWFRPEVGGGNHIKRSKPKTGCSSNSQYDTVLKFMLPNTLNKPLKQFPQRPHCKARAAISCKHCITIRAVAFVHAHCEIMHTVVLNHALFEAELQQVCNFGTKRPFQQNLLSSNFDH